MGLCFISLIDTCYFSLYIWTINYDNKASPFLYLRVLWIIDFESWQKGIKVKLPSFISLQLNNHLWDKGKGLMFKFKYKKRVHLIGSSIGKAVQQRCEGYILNSLHSTMAPCLHIVGMGSEGRVNINFVYPIRIDCQYIYGLPFVYMPNMEAIYMRTKTTVLFGLLEK